MGCPVDRGMADRQAVGSWDGRQPGWQAFGMASKLAGGQAAGG
jgi:hypothetical protein